MLSSYVGDYFINHEICIVIKQNQYFMESTLPETNIAHENLHFS